jgi:HD superfamily phosphohydrolase YqeK
MSDLDRIVYMADMTEPARHYEGVDDLRAACEASPLAECFRQGYARSLRQARISGHTLHPVSGAVSAEIERETGRPLFDPAEASR